MSDFIKTLPYILVMALVTYFIRMIPLTLIQKKITNNFVLSFLYYVPYTVLSAMTFPAILFGTGSIISAAAGLIAGLLAAYFEKSLITVAISASLAALLAEIIIGII